PLVGARLNHKPSRLNHSSRVGDQLSRIPMVLGSNRPKATREQAMNITSPILTGAANAAELPGSSVSSFLRAFGAGSGLGIIMSALAGIAAALAVAIMLSVYFRSGYRSRHDLVKHGLAASAVLVLLAFVFSDMRTAALAHLALNPP